MRHLYIVDQEVLELATIARNILTDQVKLVGQLLKNVGNIKNGDIIYIDGELQTKYLNVLIKQIEYSNLSILSIDNHLSENNNM